MEPLAPTLRAVAAEWLKRSEPDAAPVVLWPMVCGESVAARTKALRWANGELLVEVPDRQWESQLRDFVSQYMASINEVSPVKVTSIRFQPTHAK